MKVKKFEYSYRNDLLAEYHVIYLTSSTAKKYVYLKYIQCRITLYPKFPRRTSPISAKIIISRVRGCSQTRVAAYDNLLVWEVVVVVVVGVAMVAGEGGVCWGEDGLPRAPTAARYLALRASRAGGGPVQSPCKDGSPPSSNSSSIPSIPSSSSPSNSGLRLMPVQVALRPPTRCATRHNRHHHGFVTTPWQNKPYRSTPLGQCHIERTHHSHIQRYVLIMFCVIFTKWPFKSTFVYFSLCLKILFSYFS